MTVLEFWGGSLIAFGPAVAMFSLTVAQDPIKVILLITSSFFWLLSFLMVAICWAIINKLADYIIIGAYMAVVSQELFRYLFHIVTQRAQIVLDQVLSNEGSGNRDKQSDRRVQEIHLNNVGQMPMREQISLSYVSGLGFGIMNGAFSLMNVLTDYLGPGTVGLKGDSTLFLLVSSLTALAFILLNVSWSILMADGIENKDKKTISLVLMTHLTATTATFLNQYSMQLISLAVVYSLTLFCGLKAIRVARLDITRLIKMD